MAFEIVVVLILIVILMAHKENYGDYKEYLRKKYLENPQDYEHPYFLSGAGPWSHKNVRLMFPL